MRMKSAIRTARRAGSGTFLGGLAAYCSAELLTRIVRIAAILVIARQVDALIMGVAALALTLFELIRVLANAGIGQKIIAAPDATLAATCNSAHRLFWCWCALVALVQLAVAGVMAAAFGRVDIALMLAALCGVYLIMPLGLVQVFLLMRAGRLAVTAHVAATQTIADHVLTALLVLLWPTAWAIVLPKLLTAPIWLLLVRRKMRWRPDADAGYLPWRDFLAFGAGVLATEIGNAARLQLDKLIIGALLGVEALGIYYFAFNAGLGITNSFAAAFGTVLYPYLCKARDMAARLARYRHGLLFGFAIFAPVILAQILLADFYVPILFGAQWTDAAPLIAIMGFAAIPLFASAATSAWLRAQGRTGADAAANAAAGAGALTGVAMGAAGGLEMAAFGYAAGLALILIPFFLLVLVRAGKSPAPRHFQQELRI